MISFNQIISFFLTLFTVTYGTGCSSESHSKLADSKAVSLQAPVALKLANVEYSFGDCLTNIKSGPKVFIQDGKILAFNETDDHDLRSSKISVSCYLEDPQDWKIEDIQDQGALQKLLDGSDVTVRVVGARVSRLVRCLTARDLPGTKTSIIR